MGNNGVCSGNGEVCCENVKKETLESLIEYKCVEANQCLDMPWVFTFQLLLTEMENTLIPNSVVQCLSAIVFYVLML